MAQTPSTHICSACEFGRLIVQISLASHCRKREMSEYKNWKRICFCKCDWAFWCISYHWWDFLYHILPYVSDIKPKHLKQIYDSIQICSKHRKNTNKLNACGLQKPAVWQQWPTVKGGKKNECSLLAWIYHGSWWVCLSLGPNNSLFQQKIASNLGNHSVVNTLYIYIYNYLYMHIIFVLDTAHCKQLSQKNWRSAHHVS